MFQSSCTFQFGTCGHTGWMAWMSCSHRSVVVQTTQWDFLECLHYFASSAPPFLIFGYLVCSSTVAFSIRPRLLKICLSRMSSRNRSRRDSVCERHGSRRMGSGPRKRPPKPGKNCCSSELCTWKLETGFVCFRNSSQMARLSGSHPTRDLLIGHWSRDCYEKTGCLHHLSADRGQLPILTRVTNPLT